MPTKTIYIAVRKYHWQDEPVIVVDNQDMSDIHADANSSVSLYKVLEAREIEVPEIPSQAELNGVEIEGLEKLRQRVQEEAREKVRQINERIANLTCLEHLEDHL